MPPPAPKRVAAVVSVYHQTSHADIILRNLLDGYPPDGRERPDLRLVSLYADQLPDGPRPDLSRDLAKRHGFRMCDTVADALTLGGKGLAVDGVLIIGEHGDYPYNRFHQKLYPRRRFFAAVADVFEAAGRSVPVFNDKHLSAKWDDAKWVYDRARALMVPFMAGSSVPLTWRRPDATLPLGARLTGAVAVGYGPLEDYGYHAIEGLQCIVERRAGGETGVAAVTVHVGAAMWDRVDALPGMKELADAACGRVPVHAKADVRTATTARPGSASVVEVEYRDGLRGLVLMANGWAGEGDGGGFTCAAGVAGGADPFACQFYLQNTEPYGHFAHVVRAFDRMLQTGHAPYPVERTLLTSGIVGAAARSRYRLGERVETPYLGIAYKAGAWPHAAGEPPPGKGR